MADLFKVKFNSMFSAYACRQNFQNQYICGECWQKFAVKWDLLANPLNAYNLRGQYFYCPHCKTRHSDKKIGYTKIYEPIPYYMEMSVQAFDNIVKLIVKYKAICFSDEKELFRVVWENGKEIFRFDMKSGRSRYYKVTLNNINKMEATTDTDFCLKNARSIGQQSSLRFFQAPVAAESFKKINAVLRFMREALTSRIIKTRGLKQIPSLYVCTGNPSIILFSLMNFMHRLKNPQGCNLDAFQLASQNSLRVYAFPSWYDPDGEINRLFHQQLLSGANLANLFIEKYGLPNTPIVRHKVHENPINAVFMKIVFAVFTKYDYAIRAMEVIDRKARKEVYPSKIRDFVNKVKELTIFFGTYSEEKVIGFLENWVLYRMDDCLHLYKELNEENRELLKRKK